MNETALGLPFPEDSDAPDGPSQIKALAEAIGQLTLRGKINANATINEGSGFTCESVGTGLYLVKASTALPTNGIPFGSIAQNDAAFVSCSTISKTQWTFRTYSHSYDYSTLSQPANMPFCFVIWPAAN